MLLIQLTRAPGDHQDQFGRKLRAKKGERFEFRSIFTLMKLGHKLAEMLADTSQAALPASWIALAEEAAVRAEDPHALHLVAEDYVVLDADYLAGLIAVPLRAASLPQLVPCGQLTRFATRCVEPSNVRMAVVRAFFSSFPRKQTRLTAAQAYYRLSAMNRSVNTYETDL